MGTSARLASLIEASASGATLARNPEFLRDGFAVKDTIIPDRRVDGVPAGMAGEHAAALLNEVYASAMAGETPLIVTDYATAELVKVAANAFLVTKISFIGAMSEIADVSGANITELADAMGFDVRIGRKFLNAGGWFRRRLPAQGHRAFTARAEEISRGDSVAFLKEVDAIILRQRQGVLGMTV